MTGSTGFPAETRRLLSLAACIGNTFDLESLERISEKGSGEIYENLLPALETGLILGLSQAPQPDNPPDGAGAESGSYKFLHDRVQQAAYALIAQKEKQPVHLQIGQTLLKQYAPEKGEDLLFDIVHHLNLARRVKDKWKERSHLAELNLEAGLKARAASAFEQALEYFTIGLDLLGAAAWKRHYPLALSLHEEATEMSWLCGRFDLMEKLAGAVKDNAREDLDLANVYQCRIQAYTTRGELKKAQETGAEILEKLGYQLSRLSLDQWQQTLVQIKSGLAGKSVADVMRFEPLTKPHAEVLAHILYRLHTAYGEAGATLDDGLWQPIALKRISLLLNHFHPEYSPDFYCLLGLIYCQFMQDFEFGYELARLGIKLMEALDLKEINCKVSGVFNGGIRSYREPLSASLDPLLEAHKIGIETGDFVNAGRSAVVRCLIAFMCGKELNWLKGELSTLKLALKKIDYIIGSPEVEMLTKAIMILMEEPSSLSTGIMDQYHRVTGAEYRYGDQSSFNYHKLVLQTLFEEYEAARETVFEMINLMKTYRHALIDPLANCYQSLALLAVYSQVPDGEKEEILTQVDDNQDTLEKLARCAPSNYLHKHHLVEAERLRVLEGQSDAILSHYDQAIALAGESEFIHEEALANELAARYLLNQGQNDTARTYLRSALEKYEAWGAKRKVAHLKHRYPGLIADDRAEATSPSANLDLGTMLKASEAISSTLELEPLLEILLGILMENAGAQTAALILETEGQSLIAARGSAEQVECFLPLSLPVEKAGSLSLSIISWVKQSREHLVLDNAAREERFAGDDYIQRERPKSILCAPITHQSALSGIIYLENNLVEGAFTPRRLEVVKHLSSQIAISLENARLHENLKKALDELKASETSLHEENVRLRARTKDRFRFGDIIGKSEPMQQVYELILQAASTDVNVILYGETGTGKELVSKAIHEASDRKEQIFFPVNLGAIPENLIESEFFGLKKRYEYQEKGHPITGHVLESMMAYDWPGNVRELQNTLHRYVTLKRLDFLGAPLRAPAPSPEMKFEPIWPNEELLRDAMGHFEREYILKQLERNHWNRSKVASKLGIDRRTLFKKMRSYGVFKPHNVAKWEGES